MRRHRHEIALTIVALASLLLAGAATGTRAAPGPTIQGDAQAVAELRAIYARFGEAKSWRSRMAFPGPPPGTMTMEFVAPDRIHMIVNQGGQAGEYFLIGNTMYVKSGRDCIKLPQRINLPNPREHMQQESDAVIQVTRGGAEVVDGTPTQTYNLTITSQGRTVRQKMYAATATGLPRRLEISSAEGTMMIDYIDFGAGITINDPPC